MHLPGVGKPPVDAVVQEIDIKTGLVLFEWHALDHIPLSASYFTPKSPGHIFVPYHANSIAVDRDRNLLISMRNTSAVYKIDHQTGQVMWTLGGKQSSFRMGVGTSTWGERDAIVQPDSTLTVFDDGAGPPRVHPYSRAIHESIDDAAMTATLLRSYAHSPQLSANFEGSAQLLPDGDTLVDWGQAALLLGVQPDRPPDLRRPFHRAERELPRLPLCLERGAAITARTFGLGQRQWCRRPVCQLERRD